MLGVIWVKFKDYKNSLPMIIVMTVMALVLIYIFGTGFDSGYMPTVAITDNDQTETSKAYINQLMEEEGYEFIMTTYDEGKTNVEKGEYIALVDVKKGFENNLLGGGGSSVDLYKSGGDSIEHQMIRMAIESIGRRFIANEGFRVGLNGVYSAMDIDVTTDDLHDRVTERTENYPLYIVEIKAMDNQVQNGFESIKHSFMGYILFFSMFTMVFGIGSIVEEKENHVWQRQLVSPLSSGGVVLAGNMIASFIVGMIQLMFMIVFAKYVFGIDFGGSIVALFLVLACYVIAITCLGLLLSNMVKTSQQLGSFSPVIIVGTSMIGGCMWPLSIITSDILLFMADLTPQRWAYLGLKAVIVNNGGISDVLMPIAYLLIIAAVLFGVAMIPHRKALNSTI